MGPLFVRYALEDYRLNFGDEELPDAIAEEDEGDEAGEDDASSQTSTDSAPDVPLEMLASDAGAGGDAAPEHPSVPAVPASSAPPAPFGHLLAGHTATGGAAGATFVDLSMTPSPTSIARSADLDADTRLGAVPGPGFIGTSPDLMPICQPRISTAVAPVAATPGTPAVAAPPSMLPPALAPLVSGTTEASFVFIAPADPGVMPSIVPSPSATPMATFHSVAFGTTPAAPHGGGDALAGRHDDVADARAGVRRARDLVEG